MYWRYSIYSWLTALSFSTVRVEKRKNPPPMAAMNVVVYNAYCIPIDLLNISSWLALRTLSSLSDILNIPYIDTCTKYVI